MKHTLLVLLFLCFTLIIYITWDKSPSSNQISSNLKKWKANSLEFEYNGHKLAYHDSGDESKEVIILLHGYPTSSYDWHLVWKELKNEYRLVAMDMLGFGFSDKPKNIQYSTALQTDILLVLLKKLKVDAIHILAHDYGDNIVQELLARVSEQKEGFIPNIQSVTLLNGGLFPETHRPSNIQKLFRSPVGGFVSSLVNFSLFKKSFNSVFGNHTKLSNQALIDLWFIICLNNGHKMNHKLTYAAANCVENRTRWVNGLNSAIPIQFINGQSDPVSGKETSDRYAEIVEIPNLIKLETIGHYPQLECPDSITTTLKSFINEL